MDFQSDLGHEHFQNPIFLFLVLRNMSLWHTELLLTTDTIMNCHVYISYF